MNDYHVDYRWDHSQDIPILVVTIGGNLLAEPAAIGTIIDQIHTYIEQSAPLDTVYLVCDVRRTGGRLPLRALMRRSKCSSKVKGAAVVGARARIDEMAVLIMAAAKRLPYCISFFATPDEALHTLAAHHRLDVAARAAESEQRQLPGECIHSDRRRDPVPAAQNLKRRL